MRDEDFEYFISKFGEATHCAAVSAATLEKWRGKLPDQLLTYWQREGWCGYADGLFWTVNPEDYEDIVDEWLENSPFEQIDAFHVIARSAFGKLYLFGEKTGSGVTISTATHALTALQRDLAKKDDEELARQARNFFAFSKPDYCDLDDESGSPLFKRALAKLGPLAPDEVYGFEPAIVLGGKMQLENLAKLNLDIHLTILRQLAPPRIPFSNIDLDKILNSKK
jgi:hypothetical protein